MGKDEGNKFKIENSFSSDFLKSIISKELFKEELIQNICLETISTDLREFLEDKMDAKSLVIIGKAGPSLNMKITSPDGIIIFDCDFLLSFPLVKWPSPAQEWVTRSRVWPDPVTIRRLASLPCHLIGKPMVTDTATDPYTWRFSFSNQVKIMTDSYIFVPAGAHGISYPFGLNKSFVKALFKTLTDKRGFSNSLSF